MSSPTRRPSALCLQPLDPRDVPAVLVNFDPTTGTLRVNIAEVGQLERPTITADAQGRLRVSGSNRSDNIVRVNGQPVLASAVRAIQAHGSERKDLFNLSEVKAPQFQGLDGRIQVYGHGGDDTLNGSQFADRLRGDHGNDLLDGKIGNDTLHGAAGDDHLQGKAGHDLLVGGAGRDILTGGYDRDTLRGDGDRDQFYPDPRYDRMIDYSPAQDFKRDSLDGLYAGTPASSPAAGLPTRKISLLYGGHTNMLDANAFNLGNGGQVQLWDDLGTANQHWELEDRGDGTYTIWNRAAGRVLDADGATVNQNGGRVRLWEYNGDLQQRWRFEHVANGCYRVVNAASGKLLEAPVADALNNGCPVRLWDSTGASSQLWVLYTVP